MFDPLLVTQVERRIQAKRAVTLMVCVGLSSCDDNLTFPQHQEYLGALPVGLSCRPNLDGQINLEEMRLPINTTASYLVSPFGESRTVNLLGADQGTTKVWDFSVDYASDQRVNLGTTQLDDRWYAVHFEGEAFAVAVDPASNIEAIYRYDTTQLSLFSFIRRTLRNNL